MAAEYIVRIDGPSATDPQGQIFVRALQQAMISQMATLDLGGTVHFPPDWYGIIVRPPTDPNWKFDKITVNAQL